jgi:DNA-binding HxlR family transcriptional regulator
VKRASFAAMACPIAQTLEIVGDPWTLLVVRDAFFGIHRFDDFRSDLGIPRATLSARLALLVEHGILAEQPYQEHPPRHEYVLTAKGRELGPVLVAMTQFGNRWSDLGDRRVRLVDAATGDEVEPRYVDARTGTPLADLHIERRRGAGTGTGDGR